MTKSNFTQLGKISTLIFPWLEIFKYYHNKGDFMKKIIIIIGLILLIVFLLGCAKKEPVGGTTGDVKTDIDSDISDVDILDEELNTSDLDNIDKEIDEINW